MQTQLYAQPRFLLNDLSLIVRQLFVHMTVEHTVKHRLHHAGEGMFPAKKNQYDTRLKRKDLVVTKRGQRIGEFNDAAAKGLRCA